MQNKSILTLLLAAVLAALVWYNRDNDALRSVVRPVRAGLQEIGASVQGASIGRAGPAASAPAVKVMRKCLTGGQVLYTDDACPPGSQEESVSGGTITVLSDRGPMAGASRPAGQGTRP